MGGEVVAAGRGVKTVCDTREAPAEATGLTSKALQEASLAKTVALPDTPHKASCSVAPGIMAELGPSSPRVPSWPRDCL